jgi:D-alanyl-D-alanine carboxypeptidase (penicillin-binding protein 5/6)
VSAASWILYDDTYDVVLASHEADAERPMASTTKMMTALVALEAGRPDRRVVVSEEAAAAGEAEIGLVPGEELALDQLVTVLLIRSANDAAVAIAEAVSGGVEPFVAAMNATASRLGLEHTRFTNPHGLDAEGHYSSAADLLTIALAGMEEPEFARAATARAYLFPDAPDGSLRVGEATNRLLSEYDGAIGVKTGYTSPAGAVLVGAAERDGRRIYTVVMGSEYPDGHFADATALLDYGFESFGVIPLIIEGESYGSHRSGDELVPLEAAGTVEAFVHLAGSGVLAPHLELQNGAAVLVAGDDSIEAPVATDGLRPLPGPIESLSWWWRGP